MSLSDKVPLSSSLPLSHTQFQNRLKKEILMLPYGYVSEIVTKLTKLCANKNPWLLFNDLIITEILADNNL